jgi:hypothetical protein
MIKSTIEIIEAFIQAEVESVSKQKMAHMPTLGDAFECITRESISKALPSSFNLSVVSGFIRGLSEQFDCMLVHDEGEQYGLTDKFIYDIENVLIVFEVKKTLNKKDLVSAYQQLSPVSVKAHDKFSSAIEEGTFSDCTHAHRIFSQITGKIASDSWEGLTNYPIEDGMLISVLAQELYSPVKIIHGYGGYKTENGLRGAFLDFIEDEAMELGIANINCLPNLITSDNYSLFKTTGLPFIPELIDGHIPVIASSKDNVVELMVEVVWSKISSYYNESMPWGEDLDVSSSSVLLLAEAIYDTKEEAGGWKYHCKDVDDKSLSEIATSIEWQPALFPESISTLLAHLQLNSHIDTLSDIFSSVAEEANLTTESLRCELLGSKIMAEESERYIRFIAPTIYIAYLADGVAASDNRDRLDAWLEKENVTVQGRMTFIRLAG